VRTGIAVIAFGFVIEKFNLFMLTMANANSLARVKADWDGWNARSLAEEPIVRLILDGTVVRSGSTGRQRQSPSWSCSAVREDGQKVLLSVKNMGCERAAIIEPKSLPTAIGCSKQV
jgi:hypothetical protein